MPLLFAIDLSFHAGWSVLDYDTQKPVAYGTEHLPDADYGIMPYDMVDKANHQALSLFKLVEKWAPKAVVIEMTNLGKNRWSQRALEFCHFALLTKLRPLNIPIYYLDSSAWRKTMRVGLSKEQKASNAKLSKAKSAAKKSKNKLDKKALGIAGKVTKKHAALIRVKELLDLDFKMRENDLAESLLLGLALLNGCPLSDPNSNR